MVPLHRLPVYARGPALTNTMINTEMKARRPTPRYSGDEDDAANAAIECVFPHRQITKIEAESFLQYFRNSYSGPPFHLRGKKVFLALSPLSNSQELQYSMKSVKLPVFTMLNPSISDSGVLGILSASES